MRLTASLAALAALTLAACVSEPDGSDTIGNGQPLYTPDVLPPSVLSALPEGALLSEVYAQDDLPGSPGGPCYYYRRSAGDYDLINCIM